MRASAVRSRTAGFHYHWCERPWDPRWLQICDQAESTSGSLNLCLDSMAAKSTANNPAKPMIQMELPPELTLGW
jgi:hypothetical protein